MKNIVERYGNLLGGYSHQDDKWGKGLLGEDFNSLTYSIKFLDTALRQNIGKTEDITVSACCHQAIINREFPNHFCRVCNTDFSVGNKAKWNDFLVLRHPQCFKPICKECAEANPDEFHIAFRQGLERMKKKSMEDRIFEQLVELPEFALHEVSESKLNGGKDDNTRINT